MKIALASDVHLEFGGFTPTNVDEANVLILAGDICVAHDFVKGDEKSKDRVKKYNKFFDAAVKNFEHVLYVFGNHEHYDSDISETRSIIESNINQNVKILQNESVMIEDHLFVGTTLWTDCMKNNPVVMQMVQDGMNDYNCIRNVKSGRLPIQSPYEFGDPGVTLTTQDTVEMFNESVRFIKQELRRGEKTVLITHHAPSYASINGNYASHHLNGGYASDLSEVFLDNENCIMAVHGHIHDPVDYAIGATRVVSNPRGYFGFGAKKHWKPLCL